MAVAKALCRDCNVGCRGVGLLAMVGNREGFSSVWSLDHAVQWDGSIIGCIVGGGALQVL